MNHSLDSNNTQATSTSDSPNSGVKAIYTRPASIDQVRWGGNDDPTGKLELGQAYPCTLEVHSYHTKVIIEGLGKFNSVSFDFDPEDAVDQACNAWRDA